jgi:hypothetical protein
MPQADIQQLALNGFLISLKVTDFGQHESISYAMSFEAVKFEKARPAV